MEEQLIALISDLQRAIEGVAPTAWHALVMSASVKSLLSLVFILLVVTADIVLWKKYTKGWWDFVYQHDLEVPYCLGWVTIGVFNVFAVVELLASSTWIGLFDPESRAVLDLIRMAAN